MAPTVREVVRDVDVDATLSLPAGSGTEVGDVLVVFHGSDFYTAADMISPTPGTWALAASGDLGNSNSHIKVWVRPVTSAGSQTITVPKPGDNDHGAHMYVVAGADPEDPVDDAAGTSGTASTSHVAPSVSPESSDALLLCGVIAAVNSFGDYTAVGGGMTDLTQDDLTPSATFATLATARQSLSTSGATGTRTFTYSQSRAFAAVSIALKGASGAAEVTGTAETVIGFTAPATGTRTVSGAASTAASLTATAAGTRVVSGTAATAATFTATASGTRTVLGQAATTITLTATAVQDVQTVTGTAATVIGFAAPAAGTRTVVGAAPTTLDFAAAAVGTRTVLGTATTTIGFHAPAITVETLGAAPATVTSTPVGWHTTSTRTGYHTTSTTGRHG